MAIAPTAQCSNSRRTIIPTTKADREFAIGASVAPALQIPTSSAVPAQPDATDSIHNFETGRIPGTVNIADTRKR